MNTDNEEAGSNLSELLHRLAAQLGERVAVVGERDALSFAALDRTAG